MPVYCLNRREKYQNVEPTGGQLCGLNTRSVDAGLFTNLPAGLIGRRTKSPPQLGQIPWKRVFAQSAQNVHSNEQMRASAAAGGRSRLQHSQLGRSWSMYFSLRTFQRLDWPVSIEKMRTKKLAKTRSWSLVIHFPLKFERLKLVVQGSIDGGPHC